VRRRLASAVRALAPESTYVAPTQVDAAAVNPAVRRMFDAKIDEFLRARAVCRPDDFRRVEHA
jgi:hypothetical protein